jgi:hypothetical protein
LDLDPFGLYRQWFGSPEDTRELTEGGRPGTTNDAWRQWTEATTETWRRAARISMALMGLAPRWAEMAEEIRRQMLDEGFPTDPLDFYTRWYNATSGPLTKMARDILGNEAVLESSRRFLENYASLDAVFRRASEEFFHRLQLSTSSDSARVAALVVSLEDKVDRIEEAFEELEYKEPATAESVADLQERLDRVEGKLDQLLTVLNTQAAVGLQESAGNPQEE